MKKEHRQTILTLATITMFIILIGFVVTLPPREACPVPNSTIIFPAEFERINTTRLVAEIEASDPEWEMFGKLHKGDVIVAIPFMNEGSNVYNRIVEG